MSSQTLDEYSSIKDSHLAHYFSRPDIYAHLLKMGLVSIIWLIYFSNVSNFVQNELGTSGINMN